MEKRRDHVTAGELRDRFCKLSDKDMRQVHRAIEVMVGNAHIASLPDAMGSMAIYGPGVGRAFWVLSAMLDGSNVGPSGKRGEVSDVD